MKKMKILILIIIVTIGGFSIYNYWWIPKTEVETENLNEILSKVKNIDSIKYQYSTYRDGEGLDRVVVWRKGKGENMKLKIESSSLITGKVMLIDLYNPEGISCTYTPSLNKGKKHGMSTYESMEGTEKDFLSKADFIKANEPIIIGRELINGKNCFIISYTVEKDEYLSYLGLEGIEEVKIKEWVWEDYGLSIKKEETIDKDLYVGEMEDIEVNINIPDDIFKLPEGLSCLD